MEGIDVEADVIQQGRNELGGKSSEQVEEDVKDLFDGSTVNHEVERKKDGYTVNSFLDDFRLLPHQVQANGVWAMWKGCESGRGCWVLAGGELYQLRGDRKCCL